jgi:hypothetical protein
MPHLDQVDNGFVQVCNVEQQNVKVQNVDLKSRYDNVHMKI